MQLSAAARAQTEGRTPRCTLLYEIQLASGVRRFWAGYSPLQTLDGRMWESASNIIQMPSVDQSSDGTAPAIETVLAAVKAEFIALAHSERSEYYNRPQLRYLQFFDKDDWGICLDMPYSLDFGLLQNLTSSMKQGPDGTVHQVTVTAEGPFAKRGRAPNGFWTDPDQKKRYPGDRGLEDVAGIDKRILTFPG